MINEARLYMAHKQLLRNSIYVLHVVFFVLIFAAGTMYLRSLFPGNDNNNTNLAARVVLWVDEGQLVVPDG